MAGEAAVQVAPVPKGGRGAGRLPHGRLGPPAGAGAFRVAGTRAQPPGPWVAGRCRPSPLLRVRFPRGSPPSAPTAGEMGAPSSALPGAGGGGGPDSRLKFPDRAAPHPSRYCRGSTGGRPPPSGGSREQPPHKGCGRRPLTAAVVPTPSPSPTPPTRGACAECSDLRGHCKARCPFINPPHFLDQTTHSFALAKVLGAGDPEVSGAWS